MPARRRLCCLILCGALLANTTFAQQPTPPSLGLVDLSFDAHLSAFPSTILPLPDGRLLVSAQQTFNVAGQSQYGLARLNSDGSIDPTFRVGSGLDLSGKITQFLSQPDGKVVIRGTFSTINGMARPTLARLNADGSLDATFAPDTGDYNVNTPLVRLVDGRFLRFTTSRTAVTVQRLTATGALDTAYPPTTIPLNNPSLVGSIFSALDSSNRVLVVSNIMSDLTAVQL